MRRPEGFTLVELLVVIAIMGVLIALLLPAVSGVRGVVRQASCCNNLRQIGVAVQQHHANRRHYPAGNFAETLGTCPGNQVPGVNTPSEDRRNWLISILPYLEQENLFALYDDTKSNEDDANRQVRETFVDVYSCPADTQRTTLTVPQVGPASAGALNVAFMPGSYRAVSGRSDGRKFLDSGAFSYFPREWRGAIHVTGVLNFGPETSDHVKDGLSHTLMIGEATTSTNLGYRTLWAHSYSFYTLSSVTPQSRILLGDFDACAQTSGRYRDLPCMRGWGGPHRGGVPFALCDSSVHVINRQIDMELMAQLATINGGGRARLPQ